MNCVRIQAVHTAVRQIVVSCRLDVGRKCNAPPEWIVPNLEQVKDEAFFLEAVGCMEWIVPNLDMQLRD